MASPPLDGALSRLPEAAAVAGVSEEWTPATGMPVELKSRPGQAAGSVKVSIDPLADSYSSGLLLSVRPETVISDTEGATEGPDAVELRLSYAEFRDTYAADYGARLRVTAYPSCFLSTPEKPECGEGVPVEAVNDPATETLTFVAESGLAETSEPSAGGVSLVAETSGGTVYAVSGSSAGGDGGDYAAVPVTPSAEWQVGEGSGQFSYSYPFEAPTPAVAGPSPHLALSYSSGSVDGRTKAGNGQASMFGMGWEFEPGHITREYAACSDDDPASMGNKGDLCWKTSSDKPVEQLSMVLNGMATQLIQVGKTNQFRMQNDQGWKVERVFDGAGVANTDDNNEAFRLRAPNGTTYWFGYGNGSESTLTVPVFGNDTGEPCHKSTLSTSWCKQAWRWYLDRVTDVHGNTINYEYNRETNYYARFANTSNQQVYDKSGYLTYIRYGNVNPNGAGVAHSEIQVLSTQRCIEQLTDPGYDCTGPNGPRNKPESWPDVPADLICPSGGTCLVGSPTFFSNRRYDKIITRRASATATWATDEYTFKFAFPQPGDNGIQDLWLSSITRTGQGATDVALPPVQFTGTWLRNRVVVPSGERGYVKRRISSIRTETGGRIDVVYGHDDDRTCDKAYVDSISRWASTRECFPRQLNGDWEWWHKYTVKRIALGDDALGYQLGQAADSAPNEGRLRVLDYEYIGAPGWRYAKTPLTNKETWDDWRGYEKVIVHTKSVGANQAPDAGDLSRRSVWVFRGLDGTVKNGAHDLRDETLTNTEGDTYTDGGWLAGRVLQTQNQDADGVGMGWTINEYDMVNTQVNPYGLDARFTWLKKTRTRARAGGPVRVVTYEVNTGGSTHTESLLGAVTRQIDDRGTSGTSDDVATCTNWATNTSNWVRAPYRVASREGNCESTSALLSKTENYYDGATTLGDVVDGMPTRTANFEDAATRVNTRFTYDTRGRVLKTSLPHYGTGEPPWTTTTYNPGGSQYDLLKSVKTSTPAGDPLAGDTTPAMSSTLTLTERRGLPLSSTDANGNVTISSRDALGRPVWVDLPGVPNGMHSIEYGYDVNTTAPSKIKTTTLRGNTGTTDTSWAFHDGWGRLIESQTLSPDLDGRIVTAHLYDETGAEFRTLSNFPADLPVGKVVNPDPTTVPHWTHTTRDAVGRPVKVQDRSMATTVHAVTQMTYGATYDVTTAGAPTQVMATTRNEYDASGQLKSVTQYEDGAAPSTSGGDDSSATYTYTDLGQLATIAKPINGGTATYSYEYDWLGRRVQATDPDTGTTTYQYDAAGNTLLADDAMPNDTTGVIATVYDVLGRPKTRTQQVTGGASTVLAEWTYDTVPGAVGLPATSTSHTELGDFGSAVDSYDVRGNPTSTTATYPGALTGEGAGQKAVTTTMAYNQAGQLTSTTVPATSGLPEMLIKTSYTTNGLFDRTWIDGGATLGKAEYDTTARPKRLDSYATEGDVNGLSRTYLWDELDRLQSMQGTSAGSGLNHLLEYAYDALGNPLRIEGTVAGKTAATCYQYDGIGRLTDGVTGVASGATECTSAPDGDVIPVTGAQYDLSYNYSAGRIKEVADGTDTVTYSYNTTGHPHAASDLALTGTTAPALPTPGGLTYDAAGRAKTWTPASGNAETYRYDAAGNLAETDVSGGTDDDLTYAYDASGLRVARKLGNGDAVVYLGALEISRTDGVASSRMNITTPGGKPLATIEPDSIADSDENPDCTWLLADPQSSVRAAVGPDGAFSTSAYSPYGDLLTDTTGLVAERSYLNKPTDPNGDVRLDHRNYKPNLNILTTPDPLLVPGNPQSLNPYANSFNNPITRSDPSGLWSIPDFGDDIADAASDAVNYVTSALGLAGSGGGSSGSSTSISSSAQPAQAAPAAGGLSHLLWVGASALEGCGALGEYVPCPAPYFAPEKEGFSLGSLVDKVGGAAWSYVGGPSCIGSRSSAVGCAVTVASNTPWGRLAKVGVGTTRAFQGWRRVDGGLDAAKTGARTCLRSFSGATLILMADGTKKPIDQVEIGDEVVATDPETGKRVTRRVTRVWVHDDQLVDLMVDGEVITTTKDHLFWSVTDQMFEHADDLTAGELVLGDAGREFAVSGVRLGTQRTARAYNLSIAGVHTYHVGDNAVLVHNDCSDAAYQGVQHIRDEIAREGKNGSHSWAAKMSDDELGDYLDGFITRGGGQRLDDGALGWYDPDRGIAIIQRSEYSMTGYSMSYSDFLGRRAY